MQNGQNFFRSFTIDYYPNELGAVESVNNNIHKFVIQYYIMQKFSIEIRWALILTILSILWSLLEKQMGLHDKQIAKHMLYNIIFTLVAFPVYLLALRDKRFNYFNNIMTWAKGFVSGAIISVIVAILSPGVTLLTYTIISPHYFKTAIAQAVGKGATLTNAEMYFNMESYLLQNAFTALSMGLVISSVAALFARNEQTN